MVWDYHRNWWDWEKMSIQHKCVAVEEVVGKYFETRTVSCVADGIPLA